MSDTRRAPAPSSPTDAPAKAPTKVDLQAKIEQLEAALSRVAVMCGQGNVLSEYGIQKWEPGKEHMTKYKAKG